MADGHNKDMYNLSEFHTWRHNVRRNNFWTNRYIVT